MSLPEDRGRSQPCGAEFLNGSVNLAMIPLPHFVLCPVTILRGHHARFSPSGPHTRYHGARRQLPQPSHLHTARWYCVRRANNEQIRWPFFRPTEDRRSRCIGDGFHTHVPVRGCCAHPLTYLPPPERALLACLLQADDVQRCRFA
jgi:hypothetical protein